MAPGSLFSHPSPDGGGCRARQAPPDQTIRSATSASASSPAFTRVGSESTARPSAGRNLSPDQRCSRRCPSCSEKCYISRVNASNTCTFPVVGSTSILTALDDGGMVEVATVGREGMLGVSAILEQSDADLSITMVQAAADIGYRMPIDAFRHELHRRGPFYTLLTRYAVAHLGFVMQSTGLQCEALGGATPRPLVAAGA